MSENWIKTIEDGKIQEEEAREVEIGNGNKIALFYVNGKYFATLGRLLFLNVRLPENDI